MCWDFIFDWFSLCYFTSLYIPYSVLFCLCLSLPLRLFLLLLFWLTSLFHPLWLSSLPLAHCSLCRCLVFSLVIALSLSWSFSFCYVFLLRLRFVVSFVVCFVAFFLLLFCCLCVLSRMFFFGAGYSLHSYSPARVLSLSLSLAHSLFRSIASAFGCVLSLFVVVVASSKSRTS